jgi:ubiquinone/menaquinone biosynthesis C-methylase UbiE
MNKCNTCKREFSNYIHLRTHLVSTGHLEYIDEIHANWWNYIRYQEIQPTLKYFPNKENTKILEIGGGNGFHAQLISKMGYDITSIDKSPKEPSYFPVQHVDSCFIPFPSESFDLIFTSSVLPHLENMEESFNEMKRVLKKNGMMIHIFPTPTWSIVTNFLHYLFITKYLYIALKKILYSKNHYSEKIQKKNNETNITKNYEKLKDLFIHPLGNNPSFFHELYYFSKHHWRNLFLNLDCKIVDIETGSLLTSGYGIFKMKFLNVRRFFGRYFSSSYCFILTVNK